MQLKHVTKVYEDGRHNAFTDLVRFGEAYYVAFRSADAHGGCDGNVVVMRSEVPSPLAKGGSEGGVWTKCGEIDTGADDRDPHLTVADDTLFAFFGVYRDGRFHSGLAKSQDGRTWSAPQLIYEPDFWLWHPRFVGGRFLCAAYAIPNPADLSTWFVDLLESEDGERWRQVSTVAPPGDCPDEADLWLSEDGVLHVVLRRDAGPRTALLAEAAPPYTDWTRTDLGVHIGAPAALPLEEEVLLAGRGFEADGQARTMLWSLRGERHGVRFPIADCRLPIADCPESGQSEIRNPKSEIR
jgi:hypothetical protein